MESERSAAAPDSVQRARDVGWEGERMGGGQPGGSYGVTVGDASTPFLARPQPLVAPLIVPPNPFAHTPWATSSLSSRDKDATKGSGGRWVDLTVCFRLLICPSLPCLIVVRLMDAVASRRGSVTRNPLLISAVLHVPQSTHHIPRRRRGVDYAQHQSARQTD
jgi:hypothetical protein